MDYGKIAYMKVNDLSRRFTRLVNAKSEQYGTIYMSKTNVDLCSAVTFSCYLPLHCIATLSLTVCAVKTQEGTVNGVLSSDGARILTIGGNVRSTPTMLLGGKSVTLEGGLTQFTLTFDAQDLTADSILLSITAKNIAQRGENSLFAYHSGQSLNIGTWDGRVIRLYDGEMNLTREYEYADNCYGMQLTVVGQTAVIWCIKNGCLCAYSAGETLGEEAILCRGVSAFSICEFGQALRVIYLCKTRLYIAEIVQGQLTDVQTLRDNCYGLRQVNAFMGQNTLYVALSGNKTDIFAVGITDGTFGMSTTAVCTFDIAQPRGVVYDGSFSVGVQSDWLCKTLSYDQVTAQISQTKVCYAEQCLLCSQGLLTLDGITLQLLP